MNLRGVLLQEVIDRCRLSAVSLGRLSGGSSFTYCGPDASLYPYG